MGKYRIGIDVGGTKIAYGLYGGDHALLASQIRPSRPELESRDMLKAMCADIAVLLENAGLPLSALSGVGAAFPGISTMPEGWSSQPPTCRAGRACPPGISWSRRWGRLWRWITTPMRRRSPSPAWGRARVMKTWCI